MERSSFADHRSIVTRGRQITLTFNPHSLRSTLVQLAYDRKLDAERFKAWSQNLGHENCLTTFFSYGEIAPSRQAEIIRGLAVLIDEREDQIDPEQLRRLADKLDRRARP